MVETTNESIPREIYRRANRSGKEMEEADVFQALLSEQEHPARLDDLQRQALDLGMKEIKRHKLLQCVLAVRALDVTRRLDDQPGLSGGLPDVDGALADTAPALGSALAFLRNRAQIPHLRLLPYPVPLIMLARFFHVHPDPGCRCRALLVRWIWRGMLSCAHGHSERTLLRDGVRAVQAGDPDASALRLLEKVPDKRPDIWWMDVRFDGRSAGSRIAGLWLASLNPRSLATGEVIDVPALLDRLGPEAFQRFAPRDAAGPEAQSAANRLNLESPLTRARLRALARSSDPDAVAVLASHGLAGDRVRAPIAEGRWADAITARREQMSRGIEELGARLAGWGQNDRPSLRYLLRADEEEA